MGLGRTVVNWRKIAVTPTTPHAGFLIGVLLSFSHPLFLVLLGRRTSRQFPEQPEQGGGRLLVGEVFERYGCDEVG